MLELLVVVAIAVLVFTPEEKLEKAWSFSMRLLGLDESEDDRGSGD